MDFNLAEKIKVRSFILYDFLKGESLRQSQASINQALNQEAVSLGMIQYWREKFKNGNYNLLDEDRPGRPLELNDQDILDKFNEDPQITTAELAFELDVDRTTIVSHLRDRLKWRLKLEKWVPWQLSEDQKKERVRICKELLDRYNAEPQFLNRIITCDEKWVWYDNPQRKKRWVPPDEPAGTIVKKPLSRRKVMLSTFWDHRGLIYWTYLEPGSKMTANVYRSMLHQVQAKLRQLRPRMYKEKSAIFLHDNASVHTSNATRATIQNQKWELLPHPPHSPDISPCDYYLFPHLQQNFYNVNLVNHEAAKHEVDEYLNHLNNSNPKFFDHGIKKLPELWSNIISANGEYLD